MSSMIKTVNDSYGAKALAETKAAWAMFARCLDKVSTARGSAPRTTVRL
jgi:hypothetical protein